MNVEDRVSSACSRLSALSFLILSSQPAEPMPPAVQTRISDMLDDVRKLLEPLKAAPVEIAKRLFNIAKWVGVNKWLFIDLSTTI